MSYQRFAHTAGQASKHRAEARTPQRLACLLACPDANVYNSLPIHKPSGLSIMVESHTHVARERVITKVIVGDR